ncbi:MAG: tRNA pseudouridine(13) synthase TruD [Deltaproteobacteria bacterium]|nr:tRNA pseudouridine(13) synthase TruD [Deltaproteobacteria bacterium]TLN00977.1 MAG: tRNA pseudouridine(13) synthase TruD [bacterium]
MHAYLTAGLPGIGGVIKETAEDFKVTEIPLYLPCGEGEHAYLEIEKRGLTTLEAVRRIARSLGVSDRDIGYAGLKDSRGITRQTLSIPRVETDRLLALSLPGITIISANRHRNKLKTGHLAGNSFSIRVREVESDAREKASEILTILCKRGVPNYFGSQRYGGLGNSHLIGRALLRGDFKGAIDAIIGDPTMVRDEQWRLAVETYHRGDLTGSLELFPGHCRTEREVLQRLLRRPEAFERALDAVSPRLKKLYLSAYQSSLFDRILEQRLSTLDLVEEGDLAYRHDNGACFLVEDSAAEEQRALDFEISPTGPMFGCKMKLPEGKPREAEAKVLQEEALTLAEFNLPGGLRMEGERRPLRVPLQNLSLAMDDEGLTLNFSLPRGVYATTVLREIMKTNGA